MTHAEIDPEIQEVVAQQHSCLAFSVARTELYRLSIRTSGSINQQIPIVSVLILWLTQVLRDFALFQALQALTTRRFPKARHQVCSNATGWQ